MSVGTRFLAFLALAACGSPSAPEAPAPYVLRVSAHTGLEAISPRVVGSARNLLDLVYVPGDVAFKRIEARRGTWFLELRSPRPGAARMLLHPALVSAKDVPGGVEVKLDPQVVPDLADFDVDDGPFRQSSFTGDRLILERRVPGVPQTIEIVGMSSESEEWRRFLAREVDVVPLAESGQVRQLREVPSVRIVPVEEPRTAALYFHTKDSVFASLAMRRLVMTRLRRRAIAFSAAGEAAAAVSTAQELPAASDQPGSGTRVRLLLHAGASDFQRAALVIEQQLAELGFRVETRALDLPDLAAELGRGSFDLFLNQGAFTRRYFIVAQSGSTANLTGFASAELDDAIAAGDDDRARQILEREVPFTPLYEMREAAALDRHLVGSPGTELEFAL